MMKEQNNKNVTKFAEELSQITGQHIGLDHIHPSTEGRFYYIQAPKPGAPMLLNHYRGPFFIDIHPDDFDEIASGKISAHEYITSANWLIGYYWGGGSMIGGGYYQPVDLLGRKEEVRRYFKILSCRGHYHSSGYMPDANECIKCPVENCPFSKYKEGKWSNEMAEFDPRVEFFRALRARFEKEHPGYSLRGFLCGEHPDGEIWISPRGRYTKEEGYSFTTYASSNVIQSLLMHENEPEDWNEYVKDFEFRIHKSLENQTYEVNSENLEKAYEGWDFTKEEVNTQPEDVNEEKVPFKERLMTFLKKVF